MLQESAWMRMLKVRNAVEGWEAQHGASWLRAPRGRSGTPGRRSGGRACSEGASLGKKDLAEEN